MDDVVDDSDGCFGMDTLVTTSSGNQKLMKDMKIGEEVLSDETGSHDQVYQVDGTQQQHKK